MNKRRQLALWLLLTTMACACAVTAEERVGQAEGYGGTLKVMVTMDQGKLQSVQITEHHETDGVGTRAIDALPDRMVTAGTWDVDGVSGATRTSDALRQAVRMALGEDEAAPSASDAPPPSAAPSAQDKTLSGLGMTATGRVGPGKDDAGNPVYSFNVVFVHGLFDEGGRILRLAIDQLEVATPNAKDVGMPHFSGFPGQGGFALWDDAQGKTEGKTPDTEDNFLAEVEAWESKTQRGDAYRLPAGTWREQMDAYQRLLTGKTVEEAEAWFGQYCSDVTGRPLRPEEENEADAAKYGTLTEADQAMLADVTSSATISLRDSHGDVIGAIRKAWEDAQRSPAE